MNRLVVVDECFEAPGGRVMVAPRIKDPPPIRTPFAVRLRTPGGDEHEAMAILEIAHVQGPLPPFAMVRLIGISHDRVPPGTEIWVP